MTQIKSSLKEKWPNWIVWLDKEWYFQSHSFIFTNKEIQQKMEQKIQKFKCKCDFFFVTVSTCECIKEDFATTFFIALYFLVNIQMSVHILHEKNNTFLDYDEWNSILLLILCIHSCELIHFQRFSVALEYEKNCNFGKFSL